jgi:hypothetical protein
VLAELLHFDLHIQIHSFEKFHLSLGFLIIMTFASIEIRLIVDGYLAQS